MSDNEVSPAVNGTPGAASPGLQESTAKFEQDVLARGWREFANSPPRTVPLIKFAAKSDMGQVRENNEDKFDFYEPEDPAVLTARGCLYAVADGIGGAQAGQIASEMMLKTLILGYYNHPSPDPETALRAAIDQANDRVFALAQMIPERSGMGTTLTAVVFIEDRVLVAQVGDSRAYLVREREVRQVTMDHSWVEEQVRAGVMSREDAAVSPFRNVITRSIGASHRVVADIYFEEARIGDTWMLCSDGLSGYAAPAEIGQIVSSWPPSEAARQFIELANSRGGHDNITVFVLSVRDLAPATESAHEAPEKAGRSLLATQTPVTTPPSEVPEPSGAPRDLPVAAVRDEHPGNPPAQTAGWRRLFGLGR